MTKSYFEELMASFTGQTPDGLRQAQGGLVWGALRPKAEYTAAFPTGLPFSATLVDERAPLVELQFALNGDAKPLLPMLRALNLEYQRYRAVAAGDVHLLKIELSPPSDFYLRSGIHGLLAALPGLLAGAGLASPAACPLCGLNHCDCAALLESIYRPSHVACLENRLELPEQDITQPPRIKGHVATGIVGALAGALVGAVPIFTLMLTHGRVYSVLYVFLPLLSALLYRVFRGKARLLLAALSVLGASLLAALALEQVWYWLNVVSQLGHNVSLASTVYSYFTTYNALTAIRAMWLALLFLMAGYVASGIVLRRYARAGALPGRVLRGSGFVRATMQKIETEGE